MSSSIANKLRKERDEPKDNQCYTHYKDKSDALFQFSQSATDQQHAKEERDDMYPASTSQTKDGYHQHQECNHTARKRNGHNFTNPNAVKRVGVELCGR